MIDSTKRPKNGKRHKKRPEWISVRVISKNPGQIDSPPSTVNDFHSEKAQHDINTSTNKPTKPKSPKARITSWLSQQFNEREKVAPNTLCNDNKEESTLSTLSHLSSETDGRRASSVLNSPIFSRFSLKPRMLTISPRPTCSTGKSETVDDFKHSFGGDLTIQYDNDDNFDIYETANGSNSSFGSMDERLDEINDNSSASVYWIKRDSMTIMNPKLAQVFLEWQKQALVDISEEHWWEHSIAGDIINLDFSGLRLDNALRLYNEKVDYVKASVDTINQVLKDFAQIYWKCNPIKPFQCAELVYIVSHSLVSLNTDVFSGQEHTTMNEFCEKTIHLIQNHHVSIPILLSSNNGEQTMIAYLQSLYKSVKGSSLVPLNQSPAYDNITDQQLYHHQQQEQHRDKPKSWNHLETARIPTPIPTKSTSTPPQRQSQSLRSAKSSSWTLLRRKDTYRTKTGPYKEGPLSCRLNKEEWKICWVILQQGHLHIYYHQQDDNIITTTKHPMSRSSEISNKNKEKKAKKRFMQHLTSSTAIDGVPSPVHAIGGINNDQLPEKQTPYQEVNIHLGHTLCEQVRPHVFTLQLAYNSNTYLFDCGSESQAAIWIRGCNFWAARETKVVSSPYGSSCPLTPWKRPLHPAGASVLDKQGQQEAIDTHLAHLETELHCHLQQQQRSIIWRDKKVYLELEIRRYQCYHYSIQQ